MPDMAPVPSLHDTVQRVCNSVQPQSHDDLELKEPENDFINVI